MKEQEDEVRRVATAALLGFVGCQEFGIDPIEEEQTVRRVAVTETFVQHPLPQVDLLLVVDRTTSMAQEFGALSEAASELAGALNDAGLRWQLGIVDADVGTDTAGWLLGDPWVWTPESGSLQAHFEQVLVTGVGTTGAESGFAAAIASSRSASSSSARSATVEMSTPSSAAAVAAARSGLRRARATRNATTPSSGAAASGAGAGRNAPSTKAATTDQNSSSRRAGSVRLTASRPSPSSLANASSA